MKTTINRELFVETVKAMQAQREIDRACHEAFKTILPNDHVTGYANDLLYKQLSKLLQVATSDDHMDSWIEYYMWELDFGRKNNDLKAYRKDKTEIDLSTPEALYDFLIEEN